MKKKYTLTVANSQIDIITEEDKETIDAVVGVVDRKIREVYLHSNGECSRTNAAILVCLDYCAEKMDLQKALKNANAQIDRLTLVQETMEKEKAALEREIETLRASLNAGISHTKATVKKVVAEQMAFDEINEAPVVEEVAPVVEPAPVEEVPSVVAEVEKPHVKLKKKKVRAMFDNIAFDDI